MLSARDPLVTRAPELPEHTSVSRSGQAGGGAPSRGFFSGTTQPLGTPLYAGWRGPWRLVHCDFALRFKVAERIRQHRARPMQLAHSVPDTCGVL